MPEIIISNSACAMQKMEFDVDVDQNVIGKIVKLLSNRSKTPISIPRGK